MRKWIAGILFCVAGVGAVAGSAPAQSDAVAGLEQRLADSAREMDTAYRNAGSRIDIAGFDGEELIRQGKDFPEAVTDQIKQADLALRSSWVGLDAERAAIQGRIALLTDDQGGALLEVRNLSDGGSGETDWFALRGASIILVDGQRIDIDPRAFKGGSYRENYAHQCEPANMVAAYGKQSSNHTLRAAIAVDKNIKGASLQISGLDHDKPGRTPIRISINGVTLFEGENQFQKAGWSEKRYDIPDSAWAATVDQPSAMDVADELSAWEERIQAFEADANQTADTIDTATKSYRDGLVWQRRDYPINWWQTGFLRGICYESDSTLGPEHNRPWFLDNKEYVAKAFDAAGVNLIYDYPGGNYDEAGVKQYSELAQWNDQIGTPVVNVYWPIAHPKPADSTHPPGRLYLDADAAYDEAIAFVDRLGGPNDKRNLRGLSIDEPRIDSSNRFHEIPEVVEAYRAYLQRRRPALAAAGITIDPQQPPKVTCETDADLPAWMEWQYFQMEYVTDFYAEIWKKLIDDNRMAVLVSQDYSTHEPQVTAFPDYGEKLPLISTDLYNNASVNEAFVADLLRSVAKGRSILVTGAGYSARNPSRFHRTQANAMLRADGIITWIYTYASKYRHPYYFVRPHMKDDRGRELLDSWRPEYWDIFERIYTGMKNAEPYLTDTQSTAEVGVLYSMRTVIAESATGSFWGNKSQRNAMMTYSALLDLHTSVEACMVEGLTPEKLQRYRVLFLIEGKSLSDDECKLIGEWVKAGGTLISSGRTTLNDGWGRRRNDYALGDIFGVRYESSASGQSRFVAKGVDAGSALPVNYNPEYTYAKVKPSAGTRTLASWANGDPALLYHKAGKGHSYLITADRPGEYPCVSDAQSGRYRWSEPGFPELFLKLARQRVAPAAVEVIGLPQDVEVQVRRKGDALIVHLLDWHDARTVDGLKLAIQLPGEYVAGYPMDGSAAGPVRQGVPLVLRPLNVHDMIVLEPVP